MTPRERLRAIIGAAALDKLMRSELACTQIWVPGIERRPPTKSRAKDEALVRRVDAGETYRGAARAEGVDNATVVRAMKR